MLTFEFSLKLETQFETATTRTTVEAPNYAAALAAVQVKFPKWKVIGGWQV